MIDRLYAWLWSFLPDLCEVPDCSRQGVRGNENRIGPHVVCDYCHFSGKGKAWADLVEEVGEVQRHWEWDNNRPQD